MDSQIQQRVAAKAIVHDAQNRILLLREATTNPDGTNAGRYHLPGGRIHPGEPHLSALRREVFEETGLDVLVRQLTYAGEWHPIIHGCPHQIVGLFYSCDIVSGYLRLSEEHDEYAWVKPTQLHSYDIIAPEPEAIHATLIWLFGSKNTV